MRVLFWLTIPAVLLGVLVLAQAGEGDDARPPAPPPRGEAPPPPPSGDGSEKPPTPWRGFQERFDLDGDGKVTWEEYQKVITGFARMDTDGDGVLTAEDAAAWPPPPRPDAPHGRGPGMQGPPRHPGMGPPLGGAGMGPRQGPGPGFGPAFGPGFGQGPPRGPRTGPPMGPPMGPPPGGMPPSEASEGARCPHCGR